MSQLEDQLKVAVAESGLSFSDGPVAEEAPVVKTPKKSAAKEAPATVKGKSAKPAAKKAKAPAKAKAPKPEVAVVETTEVVADAPVEAPEKVEGPSEVQKPMKAKKGGKGKSRDKGTHTFGRLVRTESRDIGVVKLPTFKPFLQRTSLNGPFVSMVFEVDSGFVPARIYGEDLDSALAKSRQSRLMTVKARLEVEHFSSGFKRIRITGETTSEQATSGLLVHRRRPKEAKAGRTNLTGVPFSGGYIEEYKLETTPAEILKAA